jgi:mono/diheme cytochrome c family protein
MVKKHKSTLQVISKIAFSISLIFFSLTFSSAQDDAATAEAAAEEASAPEDGIPTDEAIVSAGEKLYQANCTQCHAINEVVIGPALKNVHERRPKEWLIEWIRNSQKLIQSGDEYANQIYEEYNKTAMPAYPFSDEEITSILSYIKVESNKKPVAETTAAADGTQVAGGEAAPAIPTGYLTAVLVVLIVVLVLILVVLGLIVSVLTKYLKDQKELDETEKELIEQRVDFGKLFKSDALIGTVAFIFLALVLKTAIDGLFTVGVQQGYQPTQPIAFSHQLHAGQYEIDCQYCHTGVRKAKSANIPSANICMNCHTAIKTESPEIQKIYAAIDYDPETQSYGNNTKPIEWIRIHNLPDLAYFNHAQHVKVGGLECETCHGPIEEMEVVYQYSTLTMGWCINCHRETEVNAKGNAYYDKLVKLHNEKSKEPMTVEDIGGLECSKCHY